MTTNPIRANDAAAKVAALQQNIERVIRGKPEVFRYAIASMLARGHILLEDVPGVGKTTLARALVETLGQPAHFFDLERPEQRVLFEEPVNFLVLKGSHELWVLLGGVPVRTFPVGLGMNGRTPEGEFVIEELMPRPDYWPPGGKRVPFGHPENPLGTRWLGFKDTPTLSPATAISNGIPTSFGRSMNFMNSTSF